MKLLKESSIIVMIALPFIYLAYIWNDLPSEVPLHWNIKGEVDRYGSKMELLLIPILLPLLIYVLFLVIPKIDPKRKIDVQSSKYQNMRKLLTGFGSVCALYIIYSVKNHDLSNPNVIFLLIGFMLLIFGNYFKTIKANYFIGIRTPWTLENEKVWKETHQLGGKLWFVGGLIIILGSLILAADINIYLFIGTTLTITLIPVIYSYFSFKKYKDASN